MWSHGCRRMAVCVFAHHVPTQGHSPALMSHVHTTYTGVQAWLLGTDSNHEAMGLKFKASQQVQGDQSPARPHSRARSVYMTLGTISGFTPHCPFLKSSTSVTCTPWPLLWVAANWGATSSRAVQLGTVHVHGHQGYAWEEGVPHPKGPRGVLGPKPPASVLYPAPRTHERTRHPGRAGAHSTRDT